MRGQVKRHKIKEQALELGFKTVLCSRDEQTESPIDMLQLPSPIHGFASHVLRAVVPIMVRSSCRRRHSHSLLVDTVSRRRIAEYLRT